MIERPTPIPFRLSDGCIRIRFSKALLVNVLVNGLFLLKVLSHTHIHTHS